VKVMLATIAGYTIDLVFKKDASKEPHSPHAP